jgi:mortality factor 4-like protein 1
MKRLEQEHRLEERREELAKQGIVEEEPSEQKLTKARLRKELANREQGLEGRRKQVHAEKLAMPFSHVLVEEWEIITQCNMLPTLPARVTVQQALDSYLASKIGPPRELTDSKGTVLDTDIVDATDKELVDLSAKTGESNCDERETSAKGQVQELKQGNAKVETDEDKAAPPESITSNGTRQEIPKEDALSDEKQTKGWKDMVDGIALLFDQAIGTRLLYRQEVPQHEWIQRHKELGTLRYCQIYGCEHLLRLFLRLPALLEGEDKSRHIFSKLNDLVRYLQKHQSTLFLQSYHTPSKKRESDNVASGCAKRRKRKSLDSPSTLADVEESLSVDTASI